MEHPIKIDDLGVLLFQEPPLMYDTHMLYIDYSMTKKNVLGKDVL